MTDLTHILFNRPPNGTYNQPGSAGHVVHQQASFDINEFPSLSKMSLLSQMQASSRANYVNIAKDNTTTHSQSSSIDNAQSEFTISSEDFPALPGSNNVNVSIIGTKSSGPLAATKSSSTLSSSTTINLANNVGLGSSSSSSTFNHQTNSNSSVANNPANMGVSLMNNGSGPNGHDYETTAAIDQCAREKTYFSPIVSTPQKSMWINGTSVDRSSLVGSSVTSTGMTSLNQKRLLEETASRFKVDSGIGDHHYTLSSHARDFYIQTQNNDYSLSTLANKEASLISAASNGNSGMFSGMINNNGTGVVSTTGTSVTPILSTSSAPSTTTTTTSSPSSSSAAATAASSATTITSATTTATATTAATKNIISKGVQISNDGRVTNIPASMVTDQFGMIGLLAFLRAAETDPNLASVTFGTDLTALGLNLTATEKLHPSFAGPWSDQPLRVHEIDYPVPSEYLVNSSIRDKLTPITLKRYHEETIFFLFYMFPNDMLQIAAAIELYSREWRYHKEEKVWITRAPGIAPSEKTNSYERGTYLVFDAHLWRRVPREFVLEYDRLESKPTI